MTRIYRIVCIFSFLSISFLNCQTNELNPILENIIVFEYDKAYEEFSTLKKTNPPIQLKQQIEQFLTFYTEVGVYKSLDKHLEYKTSKVITPLVECLTIFNKGLYLFYYDLKKDGLAMESFEKALQIAREHNFRLLKNEILKTILEYHARYFFIYNDVYKEPLEELRNNSKYPIEENIATYYTYFFKRQASRQKFKNEEEFYKYRSLIDTDLPSFYVANILKHLAIHREYQLKYNESEELYLESISSYSTSNYGRFIEKKLAANISYAVLKLKSNREREAIDLLDKVFPKKHNGKLMRWNLAYLTYWKSKALYKIKQVDSAYFYISQSFLQQMEFKQEKHTQEIVNLNIKYQTAEKEKQILEEQAKNAKTKNIVIALGTSLLLLSIIALLTYRNTKRKQRIAEQERELQIQKTTTILKEQEINTINAMVEGQEKERLRLARDLHDNLGGTLAAVKMHIGNLQHNLGKSHNPEELLDKANTLISEAYTSVRSIAHERNSGVMAKEGLLPAIQQLAKKVSSTGGIHIEVQDFGLHERLSNHLEIIIFRIVQELVTNIIKHAAATETQISLTQHDEDLNIVVEDNGKGFKVGKLPEKDGMGLGSIERRVEHLEGTMLVDSTLGKGTNIIIDIPI